MKDKLSYIQRQVRPDLFFNIRPFVANKICPFVAIKIFPITYFAKVGLEFYEILPK